MLYNSFVKYYTTYMVNTMNKETERAMRIINEAIELAKTLPPKTDDDISPEDAEIHAIVDAMTIEEQQEYMRQRCAERIEIMKDWDD